jgi:hypothetical protein
MFNSRARRDAVMPSARACRGENTSVAKSSRQGTSRTKAKADLPGPAARRASRAAKPAVAVKAGKPPRTLPATAAAQSATTAASLAAELEAAKVRIAALETAHAEVLDRLAWAIDSLQTLIESASE